MTLSSPCIQVCVVDATAGLCVGCGRTITEIVNWGAVPEAERLRVMAALPQRLGTLARRNRETGRPTG